MPWQESEREVGRKVLSAIASDKYKAYNYLFLLPFDLSQVPGYLEQIGKPLDIQTVRNNLEQGVYPGPAEFWKDVKAIFDNAIKYHNGKPTKWIAKMAKEMNKILQKERKALDPTQAPAKKKTVKLKLSTKKATPAAPATKGDDKNVSPDAPLSSLSKSSGTEGPPAKKPKLKLKLSNKATTASAEATKTPSPAAAPAPSAAPSSAGATKRPSATKAKPTQPKLKLKLSLGNKNKAPAKASPEGGTVSAMSATVAPSSSLSAATTKPSSSGEKATSATKIQLKLPGNRGKELPQGVSTSTKKETKSKKSTATKKTSVNKKASTTTSGSTPSPTKTSAARPTPTASMAVASSVLVPAGYKVIYGLRRRQQGDIAWFLQPVTDKAIVADYKAKIPHPMDLTTLQNKLERGDYTKKSGNGTATFVRDVRRIFSNALRYNTSIKDSLRPVAVKVLSTAEDLMAQFLPTSKYPPLLWCWKLCIEIIDTLYNLVGADGQPVALYFLHPVSFYCGGQFPPDYLQKIGGKPMDFGTVTAELLEGRYQHVEQFANDCRLVLSNCLQYYQGRDDGKLYTDQANRLNECLSRQLEQLSRYVKSTRGQADAKKTRTPLPTPPPPLLVECLQEFRAVQYTDKATKITEPVARPFEKPVSLAVFPDYSQVISDPMDLSTVERKTKAGVYKTPEDYEYDVNLIFRNCEVYNARRNGDHLVAMAKYAARQFRRLFYAKMRTFEDPTSVPAAAAKADKDASAASGDGPKKEKLIKPAPRISITSAQISSAVIAAGLGKSPSSGANSSAASSSRRPNSDQQQAAKANQPVPLHIAIARVKEAFPLRRAVKSLQVWEADCARYFKELMRHPWISAARPKFIFHVPVPTLFPELREIYSAKIKKPMDLTTVECTLLAGNRYAGPEDFVQDIALVFANAVRFNKDGKDIGDPLSCAYYDASVHLLRYSRWLSLELLSPYIEDSDLVDSGGPDGLPPFSWKLTTGNRNKAREEMEALVLSEPIDKSIEGDRYTWHEAECEKLLKSLRHQSDLRYMTFFLQPNYPPDYTAYISKPMDWERVQRTLKKRMYDKFGNVVDDLRLIFSNALKYNARLKGTDTVSGRAYESAKIMSIKLEAAVNKMLLSVADRSERERIDHANAEREIEAAERAEEEAIRAAWKKEPEKEGTAPKLSEPRTALQQKIRLVRRAQRREAADFEIPFFDEDEDSGEHERSYFEVVKFQKSMFEKQRQEFSKMRQSALAIGGSVFARLGQRSLALEEQTRKAGTDQVSKEEQRQPSDSTSNNDTGVGSNKSEGPSAVLKELEREGRGPVVQMKLAIPKKSKKRPRERISLQDF